MQVSVVAESEVRDMLDTLRQAEIARRGGVVEATLRPARVQTARTGRPARTTLWGEEYYNKS